MEKLSSSVRLALTKIKAGSSTIPQWSLRSLAAQQQKQSHVKQLSPSSDVAEILLKDVRIRLAQQHDKCLQMIQQKDVNTTVPSTVDDFEQKSGKRIIRAVNQPLHKLNQLTLAKQQQKKVKDSLNILKAKQKTVMALVGNLEVLHADTFALTHQLLTSNNESNDDDNIHDIKPKVIARYSPADQNLIAATFEQIRSRHASTIETMADIVIALRQMDDIVRKTTTASTDDNNNNTDNTATYDPKLVHQFLIDRLKIQLLCDHYVGLAKGKVNGGVSVNCDLIDVLKDAIVEASHICDANLGETPDVLIHICEDLYSNTTEEEVSKKEDTNEKGVYMTLVRPWVHHALVELLKNAMASSVQESIRINNQTTSITRPPDIFISVYSPNNGDDNNNMDYITCDIMDQGIGLPNHQEQKEEDLSKQAFEFAQSLPYNMSSSTTNTEEDQKRWDRLEEQQSYAMVRSPLSSLGVGLTLSQMMMELLGGNVFLMHREKMMVEASRSKWKEMMMSAAATNPDTPEDGKGEDDTFVMKSGCTARLVLSRDESRFIGVSENDNAD